MGRLTGQLERAALTSYDGILTWKIRDFSAKMEEARSSEGGLELVSLPFFTSQSGYKLQASLFLNGNGGGEGTHMSVYIKILPGEYDSILKWPFKHTVSFSLGRILMYTDMWVPSPPPFPFRKRDACSL